MSFDNLPFLGFFVVTFLAASATRLWRGWVLLAASLVFYAFAGVLDSALFAVVLVANFVFSLYVARSRAVLIAAIVFDLGLLAAFKYRDLLLGKGSTAGSFVGEVAIPLGISFYMFQSIAYLIDIYRGQIAPERSFVRFALFKTFFPQLVAGPIVRAHQFLPQIRRAFAGCVRRPRLIGFGLALVAMGVVKKVVLSDSIAPLADDVFAAGPADAWTAWIGAYLFAFQIYFDFSGYSDMAVGMAFLLGIRLPVNFRTPYLAASPREFWQRWHITLSTWIRDYLYVPLGGSRGVNAWRQAVTLLIVMGLAGLWHGANWTFVIWGLLWGAFIALWRLLPADLLARVPRAATWLVTLLVVLTLWVYFRAPDIAYASRYVALMWGAGHGMGPASHLGTWLSVALAASGCAGLLLLHLAEARLARLSLHGVWRQIDGPFLRAGLVTVIVWMLVMPRGVANPFIYFRF